METKIKIMRYSDGGQSTLGLLFIDDIWECYTLEDTYRKIKIHGQTRIPEGTYPVSVCTWGDINKTYENRYPYFHRGMLQIDCVPDFTGILFHQGNTNKDTDGCILLGNTANDNKDNMGFIGESDKAYQLFYKKIIALMDAGVKISVDVVSIERIFIK